MIGEGAPTVGVVGGGQLGRMLGEAAVPLGIELIVADPAQHPPAGPVAHEVYRGDFDDPATVAWLADRADVLTYEIELADPDHLEDIATTNGIPVHPSPASLRMTGDKLIEKQRLAANDVPVPAFRAIDDGTDLEAAFDALGRPLMVKARKGGYDGRGNAPVESVDGAREYFGDLSGLVAEELVAFDSELSVIGVRGKDAQAIFPVGENIHQAEILRETIVPARTPEAIREHAMTVANDVLSVLDGRGVFGIELFAKDDKILVNEIAPRPHNSGHYTIEATHSSQFEQHLRAIVGWPLGATDLRDPAVMVNILGTGDAARPAQLTGIGSVLATPGAHLHWYGKHEVRPLRKMGHVTLLPTDGEDRQTLLETARELTTDLTFT